MSRACVNSENVKSISFDFFDELDSLCGRLNGKTRIKAAETISALSFSNPLRGEMSLLLKSVRVRL
jgi:hypothetical protein